MNASLVVSDVSFGYHRHQSVLTHVHVSFPAGAITAVVGINGSGKSTLLKLLTGVEKPDSGKVQLESDDGVREVGAYRADLGFMPERLELRPGFTVAQSLRFYARLKGVANTMVMQTLERVGLAKVADCRVGTLSKGMRQRLNLAQALINEPKILIFDEPSNGFDAYGIQDFYRTVRVASAHGAIVILATHQLEEVAAHIDRIVIISEGTVIHEGEMETVLWQTAEEARTTWIAWEEEFLPADIGLSGALAVGIACNGRVWSASLKGHEIGQIVAAGHQAGKTIRSLRSDWLEMADVLRGKI